MFIYFVIFVVINELLILNTINICQEETEPTNGTGSATGRGAGFCTGYDSDSFIRGAGYGGRRFEWAEDCVTKEAEEAVVSRRFGGYGFSPGNAGISTDSINDKGR